MEIPNVPKDLTFIGLKTILEGLINYVKSQDM